MKDSSNNKFSLLFKSVCTIDVPEPKIPEAIVISCVCCPDILQDKTLLTNLELQLGGFAHIPLVGVTDTVLSRNSSKLMPSLVKKIKPMLNNKGSNRIIIITHYLCKEDFMPNGPGNKNGFKHFRDFELYKTEEGMKAYFPPSQWDMKFESYLVKPRSGKFQVKRLMIKPNVQKAAA